MVLLYCSTKVLYCPLLQKISLIWEVFVQVYDLLSSEDFKDLKDKIKRLFNQMIEQPSMCVFN